MRSPPQPVPEDPRAAPSLINKRVRIVGLKSQPDLNSAEGILVRLNSNGRYAVKLIQPPEAAAAHPDLLSVKPVNLELVPHYQTLPGGMNGKLAHLCKEDAPTRHTIRTGLAVGGVEELFKCLEADVYPAEPHDESFGIKMPNTRFLSRDPSSMPVGALVYNAWQGIWKTKIEIYMRLDPAYVHDDPDPFRPQFTKEMMDRAERRLVQEIAAAQLVDELLDWFKRQVTEMLESAAQGRAASDPEALLPTTLAGIIARDGWAHFPGEPYMYELRRRGFEGMQVTPLYL